MRTTPRRRARGVIGHGASVLIVATTVAAGVAVFAPVANAKDGRDFEGAFTAAASVNANRLQLIDPSAPLSPTVYDGGGPTAKARLDSLGVSEGYAAFPDPGEDATAVPSTVRGLSGVPLPDYPMAISSRFPSTPSATAGGGPVALDAVSEENSSSASASVTPTGDTPTGAAASRADVRREVGALLAVADTVVTGFQAGPLSIGRYQATASGRISPDGKLSLSSVTSMAYANVAGTSITLSPRGFVVNGTENDTRPVSEALAAAGITLEFVPAQRSNGTVTTASLRVTRRLDSGQTLNYTLGDATVAINAPGATQVTAAEPSGDNDAKPVGLAAPAAPSSPLALRAGGTALDRISSDTTALAAALPRGGPPEAEVMLGSAHSNNGVATGFSSLRTDDVHADGRVWVLSLIAVGATGLVMLLGGQRSWVK